MSGHGPVYRTTPSARLPPNTSSGIHLERSAGPPRWDLPELAGRLTELGAWGATAALTLSAELIWQAQQRTEPAAWITTRPSRFYPPDLADSGVDILALPVITAPDTRVAARAGGRLIRSGAFGLIILDLGAGDGVPPPLQNRLLGLARRYDTAVLLLTEKPAGRPSLGPLVSLRAGSIRKKVAPDCFRCSLEVEKDKRRGPGWNHSGVYRGPVGLR